MRFSFSLFAEKRWGEAAVGDRASVRNRGAGRFDSIDFFSKFFVFLCAKGASGGSHQMGGGSLCRPRRGMTAGPRGLTPACWTATGSSPAPGPSGPTGEF